MQSRRWSSNRAGPARKNRLIYLAIGRFVLAVDVRRKRNVPEPLNLRECSARLARTKSYGTQAKVASRNNLSFKFAFTEHYALACLHLLLGPDQRLPDIWPNLPC